MTKSELIHLIASKQDQLSHSDVDMAIKVIIEHMTEALSSGSRIEVRGFGSFSLHERAPRTGRNPKTGEPVKLPMKHVPHFKPGKDLKEQVDASKKLYPA